MRDRRPHKAAMPTRDAATAVPSDSTRPFDIRELEAAYGHSTYSTTPYALPRRSDTSTSAPPRITAAPGHTTPPPRFDQPRTPSATAPAWKLSISNHTEHTVTGPTLIGRLPERTSPAQHTITIDDTQHIISRNHLEIAPTTDGRLWAADLESGNGTYLTHDGHTRRLPPRTRTIITNSDTLRIGPHSIQVTR